MFFSINRNNNVLNVDETYAELIDVSGAGDLTFRFYYSASRSLAVKLKALKVVVSVSAKSVKQHSNPSIDDPRKIIDGLRKQISNAKNVSNQNETYQISVRNSDLLSFINNETVPALNAKVAPQSIPQLWSSKLVKKSAQELKQKNLAPTILSTINPITTSDLTTALSSSQNVNASELMLQLINASVDPSSIVDLANRTLTTSDSKSGLYQSGKKQEFETSKSSKLLDHFVFNLSATRDMLKSQQVDDLTDEQYVHVLESVNQDLINASIDLTIPKSATIVNNSMVSDFWVSFELTNNDGIVVDSVKKQLNISKHLAIFNTPVKATRSFVTKAETLSKANLNIKQLDSKAVKVMILKKVINTSIVEKSEYEFVATVDLTEKNGSLLYPVDIPKNSTHIYRVIPIGNNNIIGSQYSNCVLNPNKKTASTNVAISALIANGGVKLEARNIPADVIALQFSVRDLSLKDKVFTRLSKPALIDESTRALDYVTLDFADLTHGHIYEFSSILIHKSGIESAAGSVVLEFFSFKSNAVDTTIENLEVSQIEPFDVSFDMITTISDSDIDIVKNALSAQGVDQYYSDEILTQRDQLKKMLVHNVKRINLTTGDREDFGIVQGTRFSDVALRVGQSVKPLKLGQKYVYEIQPLLMPAETMLDAFVKRSIDSFTNRAYYFKPSKFRHPLALEKGILTSPAGAKTRYAKEQFSYGSVGSIQTIDVSFVDIEAKLVQASVTSFDRSTNVITWKVDGDIKTIDHFLIFTEILGVKTCVGKVHNYFFNNSCQFLHKLSRQDEGQITYVISAITNEYKILQSIRSNDIIISFE